MLSQCSVSAAELLQVSSATLVKIIELGECLIKVATLVQEGIATLADIGDQKCKLATFAGSLVVHVDHVCDLIEGEAEPLATQDELEPYSVPIVKDSRRAVALRSQQPAILVEPNGPQGRVELFGELANTPGSISHHALLRPSLGLTFT